MADTRGCDGCGSITWSAKWEEAFGVRLCSVCSKDDDLISKGNAKELYLLTDADFKRLALGSIAKSNPHNQGFKSMHLFLESQVRAAAHAKYGGEQGIEDRRTKQLASQAERRAKKRTKEINESGREAQKLQRIRDRIDSEAQSPDRPGSGQKLADADEEEL